MSYSFKDQDFSQEQVKELLNKEFVGDLNASWKGYAFTMRLGDKSKNLDVKGKVHKSVVEVYHCGGKNHKGARLKLKQIMEKYFK